MFSFHCVLRGLPRVRGILYGFARERRAFQSASRRASDRGTVLPPRPLVAECLGSGLDRGELFAPATACPRARFRLDSARLGSTRLGFGHEKSGSGFSRRGFRGGFRRAMGVPGNSRLGLHRLAVSIFIAVQFLGDGSGGGGQRRVTSGGLSVRLSRLRPLHRLPCNQARRREGRRRKSGKAANGREKPRVESRAYALFRSFPERIRGVCFDLGALGGLGSLLANACACLRINEVSFLGTSITMKLLQR